MHRFADRAGRRRVERGKRGLAERVGHGFANAGAQRAVGEMRHRQRDEIDEAAQHERADQNKHVHPHKIDVWLRMLLPCLKQHVADTDQRRIGGYAEQSRNHGQRASEVQLALDGFHGFVQSGFALRRLFLVSGLIAGDCRGFVGDVLCHGYSFHLGAIGGILVIGEFD